MMLMLTYLLLHCRDWNCKVHQIKLHGFHQEIYKAQPGPVTVSNLIDFSIVLAQNQETLPRGDIILHTPDRRMAEPQIIVESPEE